MPNVRKLSADEVRTLENKGKGQRKLVEEQYDAIISDYLAGDFGEAMLEPGENRLTVRNRLKAALSLRNACKVWLVQMSTPSGPTALSAVFNPPGVNTFVVRGFSEVASFSFVHSFAETSRCS